MSEMVEIEKHDSNPGLSSQRWVNVPHAHYPAIQFLPSLISVRYATKSKALDMELILYLRAF